MILRTTFALFAAGALAMVSAGLAPLQTSPQNKPASQGVVLAQTNNNNKNKKTVHKTVVKKNAVKTYHHPNTGPKKFTTTTKKYTGPKKTTVKKTTVIKTNPPHNGVQTGAKTGAKTGAPNANVKVLHLHAAHARQVTTHRLRGLSATGVGHAYIRGHNYSTWRHGRYRRRYHNAWVTFVPLGELAVLLIDDRNYYAYAYIDAPEDYCFGRTEDGCQLLWDEIETLEGELVGQCVAYCPWRD